MEKGPGEHASGEVPGLGVERGAEKGDPRSGRGPGCQGRGPGFYCRGPRSRGRVVSMREWLTLAL